MLFLSFPIPDDIESQQFLREAMKDGYVNVSIVKVIIVGPAGVGKTCLRFLLLSKAPPSPDERTSTSLSERPIKVIQVGEEGGKWEEIDMTKLNKLVAEAVLILHDRLESKESDQVQKEVVEGGEGVEGEVVEGGEGVEGEEIGEPEEANKSPFDVAIQEVIGDLTKQITHRKKGLPEGQAQCLLEKQSISITDTGGQQAFWDLIPIFRHGNSATLFVHRLCDKLDDLPFNDLYKKGQPIGPSQKASLTTADAFKVMLRGLDLKNSNSILVVIGTHRDQAATCEETVDQKNKKFEDIVSSPPHFKKHTLYSDSSMSKVIFELNTINPEPKDKEIAQKIRDRVEKLAREQEKVQIPIRWYILKMILEELASKLKRKALRKQECEEVASSLGLGEAELEAALNFFHKLNFFFYKKDILPEFVFTSSQVPLDKVTELVEERYHLLEPETDPSKRSDEPREGNWCDFRDQATITLNQLDEILSRDRNATDIVTARDYLTLLQGLLVVTPISDSEYFCPSLLSMIPDSEVDAFLADPRKRVATLVVRFSTGCAPPGVYCCTMCHLQSTADWEIWKEKKKSGGYEVCISRNKISFAVEGRVGCVTCIDKFTYFAVCIDASNIEDEDLTEHCQALKADVVSAVEAALENTHNEGTLLQTAFLCPRQDETCNTAPHPATISKNKKQWICMENKHVSGYLTPEQKYWLDDRGMCNYH